MSQQSSSHDDLQTTCPHCQSSFRITEEILQVAIGQVRCSQCDKVFNALMHLQNDDRELTLTNTTISEYDKLHPNNEVSLSEAMYGAEKTPSNWKPLFVFLGILMLAALLGFQTLYYQRHQLIAKPEYQQHIIEFCRFLPCNPKQFTSISQIQLLERNVYTHPTRKDALMVNGVFANNAPFAQLAPELLISLSDLRGQLISRRLFKIHEYAPNHLSEMIVPEKNVRFQLELVDPGTEALTYEFEFI